MRPLAAAALLMPLAMVVGASVACKSDVALYCTASEPCSAGLPYCDVRGLCEESGFVANTCISQPCSGDGDGGFAADAALDGDGAPVGADAGPDAQECRTCAGLTCGTVQSCGQPLVCGPVCDVALVREFYANSPVTDDQFGRQVAIDGDYVLVGTASEDTGGIGSVSVFRETSPDSWTFVHGLGRTGDGVGEPFEGLGLSNNMGVVGSYQTDDGANMNTGVVYLFSPNGSGIFQESGALRASDRAAGDGLGASVASMSALVVAGASSKGSGSGAVYVFEDTGSAWIEHRLPHAAVANERFGARVAVSADRTVVVGAPKPTGGAGSAFVYNYIGGSWVYGQTLTGSAETDRFGNHVAIHDDVIAVASRTTVYVYRLDNGIWSEEQHLQFEMIYNVAVGEEIIGVGAYKTGQGDTVWLLQRNGANWIVSDEIAAGTSVDFDRDRIAIGSQYKDGPGSARVYARSP